MIVKSKLESGTISVPHDPWSFMYDALGSYMHLIKPTWQFPGPLQQMSTDSNADTVVNSFYSTYSIQHTEWLTLVFFGIFVYLYSHIYRNMNLSTIPYSPQRTDHSLYDVLHIKWRNREWLIGWGQGVSYSPDFCSVRYTYRYVFIGKRGISGSMVEKLCELLFFFSRKPIKRLHFISKNQHS